jgi:hypothetical protein
MLFVATPLPATLPLENLSLATLLLAATPCDSTPVRPNPADPVQILVVGPKLVFSYTLAQSLIPFFGKYGE